MSNVLNRLRAMASADSAPIYKLAADEIEQARARIEALEAGLRMAEASMTIVEPRSNKRDYLSTLYAIRALLAKGQR